MTSEPGPGGDDANAGVTTPSGPARVAETHSAWVVLLGDRAYKIKKPVDLGFLDFTTRAAREAAAHREVELNRRLAPEAYLGVADVVGPDGEPCDHIVVMRRMPDERRLTTLVRLAAPLDGEIRRVARVVASFHARAHTSPEISAAGTSDAVRAKIERDLEEMRGFAGDLLDASILDDVARLARRYLDGRRRLLDARVERGLVRDGHGDLLADDIFCLPEGPQILDCIEFDDRLRSCDVLADVAFLAMDLERIEAPELAACFLSAYEEFSAERHPASLIEYYIASRALIRSKVACVRVSQGDTEAVDAARSLLALAADHLRRGRVRLVIVGGTPGTGKSTIAAEIADRRGWLVLRSDEVRKDLVGMAHTARAQHRFLEGIYDDRTNEATYRMLVERARDALELGESVILDASWSRASWRAAAARAAEETSSEFTELRCDAPLDLATWRIEQRRAQDIDPSDATADIAAMMSASFEPWPTASPVPTTASVEAAVTAALGAIDAG